MKLHIFPRILSGLTLVLLLTACSKFISNANSESFPSTETWNVVKIADGDTLTVRQNQREMKIRLCGVDAPETKHGKQSGQLLGKEAKENLQRLVDEAKGVVQVSVIESDRYNRQVAEVFTMLKGDREKSLNEEQLSSGYAFLYRAYSGKCPNNIAFENAEALAQQKRLGVWADSSLEKPWDYRKRLREKSD